jgi:hypothetical protein
MENAYNSSSRGQEKEKVYKKFEFIGDPPTADSKSHFSSILLSHIYPKPDSHKPDCMVSPDWSCTLSHSAPC